MSARQRQILTAIVLAAIAVLFQATVVARSPVPGTPNVALVTVVALGLAGGPTFGTVAGFGVGLALDLLPPATGVLGVQALALLAVGTLAGRVVDPRGLAPVQRLALVAGLALLGGVVATAFDALLGVPVTASWLALPLAAASAGVLGLALVPAVAWLVRRAGGDRRPPRPRAVAAR